MKSLRDFMERPALRDFENSAAGIPRAVQRDNFSQSKFGFPF